MWALANRVAAVLRPMTASPLRFPPVAELLATAPDIPAVVTARAQDAPDKPFLIQVRQGQPDAIVTFSDLVRRAEAYAACYRRLGMQPGAIVVIMLVSHPDLPCAFLGAMMAGLVPSLFPPATPKMNRQMFWSAQQDVFRHIGVELVVTCAADAAELRQHTRAIRHAALPIAGILTLFTFLWRRNRKTAMGAAVLSVALLAACGGGGGSSLPGIGSGNGFGSSGPSLPTPTPATGGNGGTPGPGQGTPNLANGTGDIVAGTGQVGSVSTNQLPAGVVTPSPISPLTVVAGTLVPGTSSGPSGKTQQGTYNISLVATGPSGVAHTLPINIVVTP